LGGDGQVRYDIAVYQKILNCFKELKQVAEEERHDALSEKARNFADNLIGSCDDAIKQLQFMLDYLVFWDMIMTWHWSRRLYYALPDS